LDDLVDVQAIVHSYWSQAIKALLGQLDYMV
jgi:hypothetical protein